MADVLQVTDDTFEEEIIKADIPAMVDFWAEWCGPCMVMGPILEQLAAAVAGKAKVGKLNVDNARNVAMGYGISAIPTVIIFKDGKPAQRFVGVTSLEDLQNAINQLTG